MIDGFELRLLQIISKYDVHDDLFWNTSLGVPIKFFVNCSDVFWWATADLEEVTEDNVDILEQAYKDAGNIYGGDLFAARVRKLRPQRPYWERIQDEKVKDLFLACGPERNPEHEEMWHAWKEEK